MFWRPLLCSATCSARNKSQKRRTCRFNCHLASRNYSNKMVQQDLHPINLMNIVPLIAAVLEVPSLVNTRNGANSTKDLHVAQHAHVDPLIARSTISVPANNEHNTWPDHPPIPIKLWKGRFMLLALSSILFHSGESLIYFTLPPLALSHAHFVEDCICKGSHPQ